MTPIHDNQKFVVEKANLTKWELMIVTKWEYNSGVPVQAKHQQQQGSRAKGIYWIFYVIDKLFTMHFLLIFVQECRCL